MTVCVGAHRKVYRTQTRMLVMGIGMKSELDRLERELRRLRALLEWDALYASERQCDRLHGLHRREENQDDIRTSCGAFCSRVTRLQEAFDQRPLDKSVQQWEQYRIRLRLLMDHFSSLQVIERFIRP